VYDSRSSFLAYRHEPPHGVRFLSHCFLSAPCDRAHIRPLREVPGRRDPRTRRHLNGVWKVDRQPARTPVFADLIGVKIAIMTLTWPGKGWHILALERKTFGRAGGGPRGIDLVRVARPSHDPTYPPTTVRCPGKRTRNV